MMRARSQRRSLADSPVGSMALGDIVPQPHHCISYSAHGSEGVMTRARRRRRRVLAESTEPVVVSSEAIFQDPADGLLDWRDWANLAPELLEEIGGWLLTLDVAEYLRLRAVCKPWRDHTDAPRARGALDRRFRPSNWMVLTITPDAGSRRRLLNLATAASVGVDLPALNTHCHLCAVDGLLVLFHRATKSICLLDPLCNTVTEFPSISSIVATASPSREEHFSAVFKNPGGVDSHSVNGAAFDDSTSPPTLVLCLRDNISNIIFAKPGDAHWTLVDQGDAFHIVYHPLGRVLFHTLLSQGGRCYVASPEGSIYLVELSWPLPKLVEIVDQRQIATRDVIVYMRVLSFLFRSGDGRMLMVRYWRNVEHFGGREAFNQMELFTVGAITGRFELLEVDLARRRFVPVRSLGRHAVFIGMTHCILISTETFPSIAADAIYLGFFNQPHQKFSMYHFNSRKTEPPHEFSRDEDRRVIPCVRPCNLDQYLTFYVDRTHRFSGSCINHVQHYLLGKLM